MIHAAGIREWRNRSVIDPGHSGVLEALLQRLISPTARQPAPARKANQRSLASHHPDQRQHTQQPLARYRFLLLYGAYVVE
jgi:hypothetical protein